jgi:hypothetical protein
VCADEETGVTPPEAKAWLIQQIVTEAGRTSVGLDSVEVRMLEYSETARTPDDLEELNAAFDLTHDQDAYEEKIAALIRRMLAEWRASNDLKLERWHDSVLALSSEDHYLLVMIARAQGTFSKRTARPPYDRLKLVLTAVGLLAFAFLYRMLINRIR